MRILWAAVFLASCMFHPDDERPNKPPHDPDGGVDDFPEPDAPPQPGEKRVFVTYGTYSGALTSYVDATDGLAAGDLICNLRAKAAGIGGTWAAWLSGPSKDAIERVTSQGPWKRLDGKVAFTNRAQLYGEPLVPLEVDERGQRIADGSARVWTGTRAGGLKHAETCGGWTSSTSTGRYGLRGTDFSWTDSWWSYCNDELRLVCFEL